MNSYKNPLEERYSSEEMLFNFSPNQKFRTWRKLWIALAEIEKDLSSTAIKVAKSVLKGANASDEIRNLKLRNKILH